MRTCLRHSSLLSRSVRGFVALLALLPVLAVLGLADAATIRFAAPPAQVPVGVEVPLTVEIERTLDDPVSLFSYGVALTMIPAEAATVQINRVSAVPELDFNGPAGSGAFAVVGVGFAGIKGTINAGADPLVFYEGDTLATFTLTFSQPGNYSIGLELFNTLGPTEAVFVSGSGLVMDRNIGFTGAAITAIPEPGSGVLLLLSGAAAILGRGTVRRRPAA